MPNHPPKTAVPGQEPTGEHSSPRPGSAGASLGLSASSGTTLLRCALVVALLVGTVLGYWSAVMSQQDQLPGVHSAIQIKSLSTKEQDPQAVVAGLGEIAERHGENIAVEIPNPRGRTAYVAGVDADHWLKEGFRTLPGATTIEVKSLRDLPHADYRQIAEVMGDDELAEDLQRFLDSQGVQSELLHSNDLMYLLSGTPLGDIAKLMLCFCIALSAIGVILNAHSDAVRRLHGYGLVYSFFDELRRAINRIFWLLAAVIVLMLILVAVTINGLSAMQLSSFAALFIGAGVLAASLATLCTLGILRIARVTLLLGGKLPGKSVLAVVYLVRCGACLAVALLAIGAINHATEWQKQRAEVEAWAQAPTAYKIQLSGARRMEDILTTGKELATEMRQISARGDALFTKYLDVGMLPGLGLDRDVMVYNRTAADISLSGDAEVRLHTADPNQPIMLLPESFPQTTDTQQLQRILLDGMTAVPVTYHSGMAKTWEIGDNAWMNRAEVKDPLVFVVPNDQLPANPRNVTAAVSQGDLTLLDYRDFERLQSHPEIGSFLRVATPLSQTWSKHHQEMGRTVWIYAGGFAAGILLGVIAAVAAALTSLRVFHQNLRAAFIHGVWPVRIILSITALEWVVLIGTLGYLWYRGAPVRQWSSGGAFAGSADPSLMAMLSVPAGAWWAVAAFIILTSAPVLAFALSKNATEQLIKTKK